MKLSSFLCGFTLNWHALPEAVARAATAVVQSLGGSTPQLLLRRAGLLILNLQIIHNLLHVGHARGYLLGMVALGLRVHLSSQSNYAALHVVFHVVVHPVLDHTPVQILSL